jgi:hypothetical protein
MIHVMGVINTEQEQTMSIASTRRRSVGIVLFVIAAATVLGYMGARSSSAQVAGREADLGVAIARRIATQVVTLRIDSSRGEPRPVAGSARFDQRVEAYWISVVGVDVQFSRNTEKQVNRQLFKVDPIAKVINGRDVEITGMLGIRDGSGDWDDSYEGTITVAVTAMMGNP